MKTPCCSSRRTGHWSRSQSKYGYGSATVSLPRKKSMPAKSTRPPSEPEVEHRALERVDVDRSQRRQQHLVRQTCEEPVDRPLEVGDATLDPLGQAHVLEALVVQPALLPREVREVLRRDRGD